MKKKFNPNQIVLDFFPVESVAAVNEASIRDFRRAYWEHSNEGVHVRDGISDAFIKRLAMDAATAKTALRKMMTRSKYWRESLQAWVIPITHTVEISPSRVLRIIGSMWADWGDFDSDNLPDYTNCDVQAAAYYFLPGGEDNDSAKAAIEKITGRVPSTGMKKTKIFMQVSKSLGVYTKEKGSVYQRNEARLFTTLAAPFEDGVFRLQEKDTLYVSLNPAHWLSMSNPKGDNRGDIMTSCHSFNSYYRTRSGCIGYARDDVSLIAFTAKGKGDALMNRKTSRQVFMYQNGALLQSRLYTTNTGIGYGGVDDAEHWEYCAFLRVIQDEIARCEHARGGWTEAVNYRQINRYESEAGEHNPDNCTGCKLNRFGVEVFKDDEFGGYADWECFADRDGMIRVSVRKDKLNRRRWVGQGIVAGAIGLNVRTGEEIYRDESITA